MQVIWYHKAELSEEEQQKAAQENIPVIAAVFAVHRIAAAICSERKRAKEMFGGLTIQAVFLVVIGAALLVTGTSG